MTVHLFNIVVRYECGILSAGPVTYSRANGPVFYKSLFRLRLWHG